MKTIKPYTTIDQAISSLDNGGRFYNILTKADDGKISPAEIGRVGGIFNDKQKMVLFLELSISKLRKTEKNKIFSMLEEDLKVKYEKYKPQMLLPSEAQSIGVVSSNAILTGIPKLVDKKTDFLGFIMIPIMTGKVMTFSMIPIIDQYDVYELRDDISSKTFIIAHLKGSGKLPNKSIKIAGILKELKSNKKEKKASNMFLEVFYHLEID